MCGACVHVGDRLAECSLRARDHLFVRVQEIALEISIFDGGLWKLLLLAELAKGDARHKRK